MASSASASPPGPPHDYAKLAPASTDSRDQTLVIRELIPGMLTFSVPFARFNTVPIGGRSTAISLGDKGIFVYVSHPLTAATKEALSLLGGDVKWLVTPDGEHGINIKSWAEAFPSAQPIGVSRFKDEKPDVNWAGLFGAGGQDKKYGFEPEITLHQVAAHRNDELMALHHPSGTLLQADMLFNMPPNEQYSRAGLPLWFRLLGSGSWMAPGSMVHERLINGVVADNDLMKKELVPIFAAKFDRIVPCHGDVIDAGGRAAWDKVWGKYKTDVVAP
ncbi:hypothetical protein CC85DRAFT_272456 [Cutaneotrichosporon oleaginosum]|uniref:Metallo-beta-lactamase domain-containing protein n=1 Tax=Cutaneotrichosporon oleaginosum TaxID=879819 RepID=A0A0J0XQY2_9TREE|nr:uncharacterized protein CC85DRAFT_272456 [Cutaneotrichosporon oleaginosum]KLT43485.1 hypothetical protein CC85DRAFT_272456 [Cutaneotrichosporon oleaginosum]